MQRTGCLRGKPLKGFLPPSNFLKAAPIAATEQLQVFRTCAARRSSPAQDQKADAKNLAVAAGARKASQHHLGIGTIYPLLLLIVL